MSTFTGEAESTRLDLVERLFILSAFLAPVNLRIFRAFTDYDLVTVLLAFLVITGPRKLRSIPWSLQAAALLLLTAALVSAFQATSAFGAVSQVLQFGFVFFVQLPVVLTLARTRRMVHLAMMMFILGYALVVAIAMLHQVQVAKRVLPFYNQENPNALGLPVVFLVPFVIYFVLYHWRARRRLFALVAGGVVFYMMVWALTASASRGSTAATVISVAVFAAFSGGLDSGPRILVRLGAVVLIISVAVLLVDRTNLFPTTLKDRVLGTLNPHEQPHAVTDERVALDRAGMQAFLASPLVGTGFDNFRYVSQTYDDAATFHDPHNLWIQLLAQTGLVGAAAFLFIIVRWFVLMVRAQSAPLRRSQSELIWAFVAAMTGIMAHSFLAPLVLQRHYWLLYGLGVSVATRIGAS